MTDSAYSEMMTYARSMARWDRASLVDVANDEEAPGMARMAAVSLIRALDARVQA